MKRPTDDELEAMARGADLIDDDLRLIDDDLRLIVEDFYVVRNWAALRMRKGVPEMKKHLFQALRARLGRRPLIVSEASTGDDT